MREDVQKNDRFDMRVLISSSRVQTDVEIHHHCDVEIHHVSPHRSATRDDDDFRFVMMMI